MDISESQRFIIENYQKRNQKIPLSARETRHEWIEPSVERKRNFYDLIQRIIFHVIIVDNK